MLLQQVAFQAALPSFINKCEGNKSGLIHIREPLWAPFVSVGPKVTCINHSLMFEQIWHWNVPASFSFFDVLIHWFCWVHNKTKKNIRLRKVTFESRSQILVIFVFCAVVLRREHSAKNFFSFYFYFFYSSTTYKKSNWPPLLKKWHLTQHALHQFKKKVHTVCGLVAALHDGPALVSHQ